MASAPTPNGPPSPAAAAPTTGRRRRAGRGLTIAGAACLAIAVSACGTVAFIGVRLAVRTADAFGNVPRLEVPGSRTLDLAAGRYYVFVESDDGSDYPAREFAVKITNLRTQEPVNLVPARNEHSTTVGGYEEHLLGTVRVPVGAAYTVDVETERNGRYVVFTQNDGRDFSLGLATAGIALLLGSPLGLVGITLLVVGLVLVVRKAHRAAS